MTNKKIRQKFSAFLCYCVTEKALTDKFYSVISLQNILLNRKLHNLLHYFLQGYYVLYQLFAIVLFHILNIPSELFFGKIIIDSKTKCNGCKFRYKSR